MKPVVTSFFAGVGGIDLAFKQAGFDVACANEIDPHASETYKKCLIHGTFFVSIDPPFML